MNNLVMIILRWVCYLFAFHTDISKMYNTIYLDSKHWRYQLYFWEGELKVGVAPKIKVIKTHIYGIRSSGNIAECALRKTADLTKSKYPRAHGNIINDIYVDDDFGGENTEKDRSLTCDELSLSLAEGGFKLKGVTLSGSDPPEHMANEDGKSVTVGGLMWFSKNDEIALKIPEFKFMNKSNKSVSVLPEKLTRKHCVSAVYSVYDPIGKVTPVVSGLKLDLHDLVIKNLDWDDQIPDNLRQLWESNFEMIQELGNFRYKRAVIPEDAIDLDMETLDFADASQSMICVAIYVRFKLKSGDYSAQLLFSRSKTVPKDMTLPRAELLAASLNASTGHIVKSALGDRHKQAWKFTDSQVVMFWINCFRSKLKMFVRNLVILIHRLSVLECWAHVDTHNMIADIGTRSGVKPPDVGPDSTWILGLEWFRLKSSEFPSKTVSEIILDNKAKQDAQKEVIVVESVNESRIVSCASFHPVVPASVKDRYSFSKYLIDPNKFRFRKVIRVLGWVYLFVNKFCQKYGKSLSQSENKDLHAVSENFLNSYPEGKYVVTSREKSNDALKCKDGLVLELPKRMICSALRYYFVKSTHEIKKFIPVSKINANCLFRQSTINF